jgi:hypothetical protein
MEDSIDCPLCCTELDITDRAIQYCECGCECHLLLAHARPFKLLDMLHILEQAG